MVRIKSQAQKCAREYGESIEQYINRFKAPALAYLNLTRNGQGSSDSPIFAITLILNAKLPARTFSNLISSIIQNIRAKKSDCNNSTEIWIGRLKPFAGNFKTAKSVDESRRNEGVATTESAITAQKSHTDREDETYTSFQDAIRT